MERYDTCRQCCFMVGCMDNPECLLGAAPDNNGDCSMFEVVTDES